MLVVDLLEHIEALYAGARCGALGDDFFDHETEALGQADLRGERRLRGGGDDAQIRGRLLRARRIRWRLYARTIASGAILPITFGALTFGALTVAAITFGLLTVGIPAFGLRPIAAITFRSWSIGFPCFRVRFVCAWPVAAPLLIGSTLALGSAITLRAAG